MAGRRGYRVSQTDPQTDPSAPSGDRPSPPVATPDALDPAPMPKDPWWIHPWVAPAVMFGIVLIVLTVPWLVRFFAGPELPARGQFGD